MTDILPCPWCPGVPICPPFSRAVMCDGCGALGPTAETRLEAIAAWNRVASMVQNKSCYCNMRTRLVGDECAVCNPDLARELVEERDDD